MSGLLDYGGFAPATPEAIYLAPGDTIPVHAYPSQLPQAMTPAPPHPSPPPDAVYPPAPTHYLQTFLVPSSSYVPPSHKPSPFPGMASLGLPPQPPAAYGEAPSYPLGRDRPLHPPAGGVSPHGASSNPRRPFSALPPKLQPRGGSSRPFGHTGRGGSSRSVDANSMNTVRGKYFDMHGKKHMKEMGAIMDLAVKEHQMTKNMEVALQLMKGKEAAMLNKLEKMRKTDESDRLQLKAEVVQSRADDEKLEHVVLELKVAEDYHRQLLDSNKGGRHEYLLDEYFTQRRELQMEQERLQRENRRIHEQQEKLKEMERDQYMQEQLIQAQDQRIEQLKKQNTQLRDAGDAENQ